METNDKLNHIAREIESTTGECTHNIFKECIACGGVVREGSDSDPYCFQCDRRRNWRVVEKERRKNWQN